MGWDKFWATSLQSVLVTLHPTQDQKLQVDSRQYIGTYTGR
jgi:hypothetical protein